jgi:hypothetical protein
MSKKKVGHALKTLLALSSAALGLPLFVHVWGHSPEKVSDFLYECLTLVPSDWYFTSLRLATRDWIKLNGRMVVCLDPETAPSGYAKTSSYHQIHTGTPDRRGIHRPAGPQ